MKLPSLPLFKRNKINPWRLPSLKHLKTKLSPRNRIFENASDILSDTTKFLALPDASWSQSTSIATQRNDSGELVEAALKSRRLTMEPGTSSSSILGATFFPYQEFRVETIDTENPYVDFRNSMEEMAKDYGVCSFEEKHERYLEELLSWYLRMNKKENHGCIVQAFIDMFAGLLPPSFSSSSSFKSQDCWEIEVRNYDRGQNYAGKLKHC